jgi:hypothetical protein
MELMNLTAVVLSAGGESLGSALLLITLVLSGALAMPLLLARLEPDGERPARRASMPTSGETTAVATPDRPDGSVDRPRERTSERDAPAA